jgi:hypothetical protein
MRFKRATRIARIGDGGLVPRLSAINVPLIYHPQIRPCHDVQHQRPYFKISNLENLMMCNVGTPMANVQCLACEKRLHASG